MCRAPQEDHCRDGGVLRAPALLPSSLAKAQEEAHAPSTPDGEPSSAQDLPCHLLAHDEPSTPAPSRPQSILRASAAERALPSHWPTLRVHFPNDSVVTAVRTRPYTHLLDIPALYYSADDVRRFKREYRLLAARAARMRESLAPAQPSEEDGGRATRNNSYWRSKVGGRFSPPTVNGAARVTEKTSSNNADEAWDPLNDGSGVCYESDEDAAPSADSTSSTAGLFSSVFDVARGAVSLFQSSSVYYYEDQLSTGSAQPPKRCPTSTHLIDTLYLF